MSELDKELNPDRMAKFQPSSIDDAVLYEVRPDKTLHAFQRYETYIARSLNGPYILDPKEAMGVSPNTFRARFKDAIRGFIDYKYPSDSIPHTDAIHAQLEVTVALPIVGGKVRVFNKRRESVQGGPRLYELYTTTDLQKVVEKFESLKVGDMDILKVHLPEGKMDDKIIAIHRYESEVLKKLECELMGDLFEGKLDSSGLFMIYTRRTGERPPAELTAPMSDVQAVIIENVKKGANVAPVPEKKSPLDEKYPPAKPWNEIVKYADQPISKNPTVAQLEQEGLAEDEADKKERHKLLRDLKAASIDGTGVGEEPPEVEIPISPTRKPQG